MQVFPAVPLALWMGLLGPTPPLEAAGILPAQDGLTVDGVAAVDGSDLAKIHLEVQPAAPFPGQSVELAVFVELDQRLTDGALLDLFRRELDLEVQLRFPALEGWDPAEPRSGGLRYALDDEVARIAPWGESTEPMGRYRATWRRTLESPGDYPIPGPLLRFAYTTGFRADLLAGSVPNDRVEAYVQAPTLTVSVSDFPEAERPPEFRGDLGRFTLETVPPSDVLQVGQTFQLAVLVRPLDDEPAPVPPFPPAPDLRLLDTQSIIQGDSRLVTWTAEPMMPGMLRLPPIVLASFDPVSATYVVASTESATCEVLPPSNDLGAGPHENFGSAGRTNNVLALCAAMILVVCIYWWRTRSHAARLRQGQPKVVLAQATAHDQVLGALAARLGCTHAAVAGPGLARRLVDAGVDSTAATRAAELFHALESERFGGPDVPERVVDLGEVLRELRIPG